MRYSLLAGGKRLRPAICFAACEAAGGTPEDALPAAVALELIHTYSLVHDDLPCMDDDDLRRGRPTCHIAFDEATAVLAGDALLTLAFEVAAEGGAEAVVALARGAGAAGMVGGQVLDLAAENAGAALGLDGLERIHDGKTGALIIASLEVGRVAGGAGGAEVANLLAEYGALIGRAFQVADDCLDVTGTAAELGKTPGADQAHGKSTYPALLGLQRSLEVARELSERAGEVAHRIARLGGGLDGAESLLQDLALSVVSRKS
ncbi:MAG: polyprenyl synthetase family protein [Gemmatimonadetes bacterium]|nr:polyprenyl synthetase family protein [Gemmatimonadota bacterium]